jgi:hypothetical protein
VNTRVGEKTRTITDDETPRGWDHDPPPKQKWTPLGILVVATGALSLIFGSRETSDFWVDGLQFWWTKVQSSFGSVRRLILYLDNGPHNSGSRTQFLKRMVEFADWSGLEIRLVYHPPYHSKYNPIERCWSALESKWGGTLLSSLGVILHEASRMVWCGQSPIVDHLAGTWADGVKLTKKEMAPIESRLERSKLLPRYDERHL